MKTTKADFEYFQKCCEKWRDFWGLYDLEFVFVHEENKDGRAWYVPDYDGCICLIGLSTVWYKIQPTREKLDFAAFHEVTEMMLMDMRRMALYSFNLQEVDHHTHKIIRRLENCVFKKLK